MHWVADPVVHSELASSFHRVSHKHSRPHSLAHPVAHQGLKVIVNDQAKAYSECVESFLEELELRQMK